MKVAAATDFWIGSASNADRYITMISFVISDATAALNNFGAITALTNGCQLIFEDAKLGSVTIADALKSNFDFIRLCSGNPPFGDGAGAFRANNVEGNSEGYIPVLDIKKTFGLPYGLRIPKNSELRLLFKVRDATNTVDKFDCIAYGFDRLL